MARPVSACFVQQSAPTLLRLAAMCQTKLKSSALIATAETETAGVVVEK
jgi:hypothetical protein